MEGLAKELIKKINRVSVDFYYFRDQTVVEKGKSLLPDIQHFASNVLQMLEGEGDAEEYIQLKNYILQVLNDYMEAIDHRDMVLIIDTLDVGLREVLNLFVEEENGENGNE